MIRYIFLSLLLLTVSCSNKSTNIITLKSWCNIGVRGINIAGAEFGAKNLPGRRNYDYFFLDENRVKYYQVAGFNSIRLPILWERLQPELNQPLDSYYLSGIKDSLRIAERYGMWLILDLHNYGYYRKKKIGSAEVSARSFADTWYRLVHELKDYPALLGYGLMNEPHGLGAKNWEQFAQQAVNSIRKVDPLRFILVAGEHWSNANRFSRLHPLPFIEDPANRVVYEAHAYFDKNQSGTYQNGYDAASKQIAVERIESFLDWLSHHNQHGFIGEFSVPGNDSRWLLVLDHFMQQLDKHGNCVGWAYWAGGRWSPTYSMALEPIDGQDRPQLQVLQKYLKD